MLIPLYDSNPLRRPPVVTIVIIALNVLSFLYVLNLSEDERTIFYIQYGFVPARMAQLQDPQLEIVIIPDENVPELDVGFGPVDEKLKVILPPSEAAVIFSLFSSLFLHGGWMHLIGNMWFLWIFGNNVEDRLGRINYLLFYLLGGVFASLCHWFMSSNAGAMLPVVGASGAVAVMLGAYAVTYPTARVKVLVFVLLVFLIDLPAMIVLGFWIGAQVFEAFGALQLGIDGGVAWWAHIGGFVAGAAAMPILTSFIPDDDLPNDDSTGDPYSVDPRYSPDPPFGDTPARREPPAW